MKCAVEIVSGGMISVRSFLTDRFRHISNITVITTI
jgi:hypothetical protein